VHGGNPPADSQVITYGKPHCKSNWVASCAVAVCRQQQRLQLHFVQTGSLFTGCTGEESFLAQFITFRGDIAVVLIWSQVSIKCSQTQILVSIKIYYIAKHKNYLLLLLCGMSDKWQHVSAFFILTRPSFIYYYYVGCQINDNMFRPFLILTRPSFIIIIIIIIIIMWNVI